MKVLLHLSILKHFKIRLRVSNFNLIGLWLIKTGGCNDETLTNEYSVPLSNSVPY